MTSPLKGVHAEFVTSVASPAQLPADGLPELALVGRSNVGKSSLINSLLGRPRLARTSNTPGRTQLLNFFRVSVGEDGPRFYLVDAPGYGFARVSREMRARWAKLIEGYLASRHTLRGVIQVVDFRHPPTADDGAMYDWLRHHGLARMVVATKVDKVGRSQWPAHQKQVRATLALGDGEPVVFYSSETGLGREELWHWVLARAAAGGAGLAAPPLPVQGGEQP